MIRLTTLGAVRVHRGHSEVPDLPAQRLRFALLLYLASERDVSREEVVGMFWPERDTARGRHALRQMLYELRNVLGEEWVDVRRDRILCNIEIDTARFESAATEGLTSQALDLYLGPFLAGFALDNAAFEGWVERRRAQLGRLHRRLQREHIAALLAQGRSEDALTAARRWVELEPLDDEAAHALIERLAFGGQRTEALQYFESYAKQLAAELQVEPLEETLALVASIRSGEPSHALTLGGSKVLPGAPVSGSTAAVISVSSSRPTAGARLRQRVTALLQRTTVRRVIVTLLVLCVAGSVALMAYPRDRRPLSMNRTLRIAVLPLEDRSEAGALGAVAEELTQQLTASLGQSRVIEVVSGVELQRLAKISADSVGRVLGADYLVGGSIRRNDDRVQLSLELLDGRSGGVVRRETVERVWGEAQNLVDDVVTRAATVLRKELGTQMEVQQARDNAGSQRSFQLVLDGKALVNQSVTLLRATQDDAALRTLARADSLFAIAESIDPKWAEPLVQRAQVRQRRAFLLRFRFRADPRAVESCILDALEYAERASARSPDDAGAHEMRGMLLKQLASEPLPADSADRLLEQAERSLQRAVEIQPQRQTALRHLAELLLNAGRYGEARIAAAEAHRADPHANRNTLLYLLFSSNFEAGEDELADGWCMMGRSQFKDQAPFTWCLFAMHAWGTTPPQPANLRRDLANTPPIMFRTQPELIHKFDAMVAAAFARAGQPDSARAILRRLEPENDQDLVWLRAAVHVQLDEHAAAMELLRTLPPTRYNLRVMRQRPFWKLGGNTEFERLTRRRPL